MAKHRSIERVKRKALVEDKQARDAKLASSKEGVPSLDAADSRVVDSFVNFAQKMGIGADNPTSTAGYGFNPISRIRTQLEWIHRGSWLGGVAVDLVADDMTRGGVDLHGTIQPDEMAAIEEAAVGLGIWNAINETIKWARLYGGCIAVMLVDGQDFKTPLRLDTVGKGQFKGLLVLDRWMIEPSLSDLVTAPGPDLGLPKYYMVTADAPALPRLKVHYSRCIRLEGIKLPYWQRVQENLWGLSVLERLYDRMVAFDSATTGAAQLVYKSYLRTYKVAGMRELVSAGGEAMNGLIKYVDMMRRFQGIEGITLLDGEDDFQVDGHSAFGGLSEVLTQFGQQISGALQIPLVRLFGQSPSGFSTGDTDLRSYYDTIKQRQEQMLRVGVTKIYRALAQSEGVVLPDGFRIEFRSLWQLNESEKSEIAGKVVTAVTTAQEAGLISDKAGMQELRQSSHITGIFSNITDDDIENASSDIAPPLPESDPVELATGLPTGDSIASTLAMKLRHDLDVVIEDVRGSPRQGTWGSVTMPADYGYLRGRDGADGGQVDCYVGPDFDSTKVWMIDQTVVGTTEFDEHKVMLGFPTWGAALGCYLSGFNDGKAALRIGCMTEVSMSELKRWLTDGDLTTPYADLS